jgi:hypothetical protein
MPTIMQFGLVGVLKRCCTTTNGLIRGSAG